VRGNANQVSITLNELFSYKFLLPTYDEQRKIAKILSTWDKAIATTEKLIATSQQQKKALMQQLLTGKKRLVNPETGKVFEGEWEHQRLASLCTIKTGKKDVNEGNPEGNYPFFTCASEPTKSDNYSYDCEALLIAGNGMLGKTHYFNGKFEAYQRTYILSEFIGIDVPFLHQYILYWLMRDIDREKQHGAMPYIKLGLLQNFKVLLPSIAEQQKIAAILSCADQEITALQQKLDALKQEKKALMQQLLTGKRRVKVDENVAA
jgi:type I restriction enzyme S subunit